MAHYANQKTITINREAPKAGCGKQYLSIYSDSLAKAARLLSSVGFKLYLYLASNQNNYTKDYSPRDFANVYGVSYESARKAPQNLIDNGYLVPTEGNKLAFYEEPQNKKIAIALPSLEMRAVPQDDGTYLAMTYDEVAAELVAMGLTEKTINDFWNGLEVM